MKSILFFIANYYHNNYNHNFLDDTPILKMSPNSADVFDLIKCHSSRWDEFASGLRVPFDTRESLRHNIALEDGGRLERVVVKWIESQCSPVTWENIIHTLVSMDLKRTAGEVQDYLKHQQVISKSQSKHLYTTFISIGYLKLSMKECSGTSSSSFCLDF